MAEELNWQDQLDALLDLLSTGISKGAIITAASHVIWEEKFNYDQKDVEKAESMIRTFKSESIPISVIAAAVIAEVYNSGNKS